MTDSDEADAARRWAAAERAAAGLPPETGPAPGRGQAWVLTAVVVLAAGVFAGFVAFVLLLPQSLFGGAVAVPGWLQTTGLIIEWAGILLGIFVWVRAGRTGERPISMNLVVAQLSFTQKRRVANQIKGREPAHPEEMRVVIAAARQAVAVQRFSLRLLLAYVLFALGNLMWTDWVLARILYAIALAVFVVAVPLSLKKLRRVEDFLQNTVPDAPPAP
ncbi:MULTISPECIES: hypothetical protein [Arthrobacter]|uniref:Uncharacterized protein n=1 Tax=Arthrobacter terricola TaxID=2547396 RepID=A0A4V2ZSA1_9MICC|nr:MULTISPECIES: hypothetical protein [Arthrobacter]MBT8162622.1 hypothetical protein [Arthrobacter sp. GN70]TDF92404.1 hypothetical protein E1809_17835 [Arthrobacter terricola]